MKLSVPQIMTSRRTRAKVQAELFCDALGVGYKSKIGLGANVLITHALNDGWWDKCVAIYPFVGGSATTNAYNLKDPRNVSAAYYLTFGGGWTHTTNSSTPNGTTGYADTNFPANTINAKTSHMSFFSSTSSLTAMTPMGNENYKFDAVVGAGFNPDMNASVGAADYDLTYAEGGTSGYFAISRDGNNDTYMYLGGTEVATGTQLVAGNTANNIFIGARNNAGATDNYSNLIFKFATIGTNITATDATNMNYVIDLFIKIVG